MCTLQGRRAQVQGLCLPPSSLIQAPILALDLSLGAKCKGAPKISSVKINGVLMQYFSKLKLSQKQ